MVDAPERIWAWIYSGGFNRGEWTGQKAYQDDVEYIRADLATLSDAVAEREAEPVAFLVERLVGEGYGSPRSIVDAAKYDPRRDEFWCGDAKSRHLVTPLYALSSPPTSELEALRKRVAELKKAMGPFADIADLIDAETEGMSETDELELHFHDYLMASWPVAMFRTARRIREGGKVE